MLGQASQRKLLLARALKERVQGREEPAEAACLAMQLVLHWQRRPLQWQLQYPQLQYLLRDAELWHPPG